MGEESAAIREEIAETRASMEETVEALSHKTDVKGRVQDSVEEKKDAMSNAFQSVKRTISGKASEAERRMPDSSDLQQSGQEARQEAKRKARRGKRLAEENPLGLGLGAVAAGFLAGLLIPSTRVEDEELGELADSVKEHLLDTGQEALERGKEVAQDAAHAAAEAAKETAQEEGQQHAEELAESAKEHAQSI
jgi:ElaB/YqjD/DUF883 family membrane-anchored ribosome-binding protein